MTDPHLRVLFEDNHCLAIDKPAGLLTMGDDTGDPSAVDIAGRYLKAKYNKPGNVFVGIVHRLDRPVSGVLLLARTSKAASRLCDQFRTGSVKKTYRALVEGRPGSQSGYLVDWLRKDRTRNQVEITAARAEGAREAKLEYRLVQQFDDRSLVEITPITGRSHQIRVQLANLGHPIVGDLRYGAETSFGGQIALHATRLEFLHPTKREAVVVSSEYPEGLTPGSA